MALPQLLASEGGSSASLVPSHSGRPLERVAQHARRAAGPREI
jgi:hypothetical protein